MSDPSNDAGSERPHDAAEPWERPADPEPTCAECGGAIREDDVTCPHCGVPLAGG